MFILTLLATQGHALVCAWLEIEDHSVILFYIFIAILSTLTVVDIC